MQAIEFNSYVNEGNIKIPANYQDWYGAKIKVILLRQDTLTSQMETSSRSSRPIGLASAHPETLPKLKLWIPRCPLFGVQSFSFGIFIGVSGWTLIRNVHKIT